MGQVLQTHLNKPCWSTISTRQWFNPLWPGDVIRQILKSGPTLARATARHQTALSHYNRTSDGLILLASISVRFPGSGELSHADRLS